jgi:L-asparaginase II
MSEPLVVEVTRSGAVESTHLVDAAVVDRQGALVAWAGDAERAAAFRSSAKPIQARIAREAGWEPADTRALAIASASHSGSPEHVEAVRAVLDAAGLDERALGCPAALPLDADAARHVSGPAPVLHNCSGKHAAMLAACVAAGWDLATYRAPEHPLQQRIRARLGDLLGGIGPPLVDGCGVPTCVAPLAAFARAFGSVEAPETDAMRAHPVLVGGEGRVDTTLMQAVPRLVAKGGAEALLCLAVGSFAVALKVRDGSPRAVGPAALVLLSELGIEVPDDAAAILTPPVLGGGMVVGSVSARGTLSR